MDDKSARLDAASNPRQATLGDAPTLARMFAAAFSDDPLFDYMVRPGVKRRAALELFFHDILFARDIPQGEVWMSADAHACVSWLLPGGRRSLEGFVERPRWLPFMLNVFGFSRLGRFMAVSDAMDKADLNSGAGWPRPLAPTRSTVSQLGPTRSLPDCG